MDANTKKKAGTFTLNKSEPIHSWYSYVEGYSSCLVTDQLDALAGENIKTVYDPFGGTGTTPLVAVQRGLHAFYSETNPFMLQVIDSKINCVKRLVDSGIGASYLRDFRTLLASTPIQLSMEYETSWDGFEKFFAPRQLHELLFIKQMIDSVKEKDSKQLLMLALSSITVPVSKMVRRGDLRYATENEKDFSSISVSDEFLRKLDTIIDDIEKTGASIRFFAEPLSDDARDISIENIIDCVITSPPYLNGTNYIRNTKLELKVNGFVKTEEDLPAFHSKGIIAGINNVSKRSGEIPVLPVVQPYIEELEPVVYDQRITLMVAGYFNDMSAVISRLSHAIRDGGFFIMDIGDSQFAGVHIPTHDILSQIAASFGFEKYDESVLRERRSKNGMVLSQRVLKFKLHKTASDFDSFRNQAVSFITNMPYKKEPFSGRNWGHPWHSLCSYHGKLKPAIAHFLVEHFTRPGDTILDPLCGVGTIPFEACLQGRIGIGNDLSEMAYTVTKAKLEKPSLDDALSVLPDLASFIEQNKSSNAVADLIEKYKDFGFNGKVAAYFHDDTFREVLAARMFFLSKMPNISVGEAMAFSAFLHVLHGNRPYALSRNSHPLTPYAPKGDFIYKSVVEHIRDKIVLSYDKGDFSAFVSGKAILGDYNDISGLDGQVDYIICSPPFADSIRFYMQNWMRLWLCGWEPETFKHADETFLDVKQRKDFSVYSSFFAMCARVLKPAGKVVLHLGKTEKVDMAEEISKYAADWFDEVYRGSESVSEIEKHGIKDKGATLEHEYLFLIKR